VPRSYDQHCGLARALDVVGERWSLLVVRELELGPKRFTDLADALPGMGRNLLSERLRRLEAEGVITRRGRAYMLTEDGRALRPAVEALAVWGFRRLPPIDPEAPPRAAWAALTMRAAGHPGATAGVHGTVQLEIGEETVSVRLDDGSVDVVEGSWPTGPDAVLACDLPTFMELGLDSDVLQERLDQGRARLTGDSAIAEACFAALQLPVVPGQLT
jgi:DNA-binding HxlR family transcriptional regulator